MAPSAIYPEHPKQTIEKVVAPSSIPQDHVHGAEDKTPCEAISHGPIAIQGIPTFSTFQEEREHILIHLAATFRIWARSGFTEGISGHISVRDPEHEHYIWMNPLGKHFGLLTASDMICLDVRNGDIVGGNKSRPANSAGFLIHSEIHKARPDVHSICHAHTIAGRAWSAFGKPLEMLTQDVCNFYNALAVYDSYGGIVFAADEGKQIAKAMGAHSKGAILMNHGLVTVGSTVDEAGFLFGALDRHCQIQLQIEAACAGNPNLKKQYISNEEAAYNFKMASEKNVLYVEAQPDIEYEIEMAGGLSVLAKGAEKMAIDVAVS